MSVASANLLQEISAAVRTFVAQAAPSLVAVRSRGARSSGFMWRPGLVVTSDEALADEGEVTVSRPGDEAVPAEVIGRDPTTDIALLRIAPSDTAPAVLAPPPGGAGEVAIVVGVQDGEPTAAFGVVSRVAGPWRSLRGGEIDARIELDLSMRSRAEGGLALDAAGRPFGIAVFGPRRSVLVIPSSTLERVGTALEKHGRIARGYVGLGLQQVRLQEGGVGVMVMSVDPHGPGAAAGIHQGDVLVTWDREPVRGVPWLRRALGPSSVGRTIAVELRRAGSPVEVSVRVDERSPS